MPGKATTATSGGERLEYGVLGPLEVRRDGRPLPLGGARQRGLLAYLLLHANRSVRTEDLIAAVWRDPPLTCRKIVQIAVSELRRSFGEDVLATQPHGYRLAADPTTIDAHRFASLVAEGRDALARADAAAAADLLGRALELWRGTALADLEEEPFVAAERVRLEELRLAAIEDRIEAELLLGREHALIGELEQLVAAEPLRERPRAQLMTALYRAGRQAEALEVYQDARKTLVERAGIEPGPALKRLELAILRQDVSLDTAFTATARPQLPLPANRLIGRERELEEACAALGRRDVRLVTVTGPGGVGKTRVALEAARRLAAEAVDSAAFVPLDAVTDPAFVAAAIGRGVGARGGGENLVALHDHLSGRSMLLVLDSFEHLTGAAPLLAELVVAAPKLKLLVTSRVSLHLSCEHELALEPLALPVPVEGDTATAVAAPAVELFLERARAVRPDLPLTDANAAAVAEICRRLDGLPLAIELAAARTKLLTPPALLERLGRRLDVLVGGPVDAPPRQRTLRATVDWSYRLLSAAEQQLFARLGVFVGGCELEAIEAVCDGSDDVLETLEGLAAHSLVRRELRPHTRIAMLDTLREFAAELLARSGEADTLASRHAEWYVEWAERAEAELRGPEQASWLRRLEDDHANLIAALGWLDQAGDGPRLLRLASALRHYWFTNGYVSEARQWLACALAAPGESPPALRAKALQRAAVFANLQLDSAAAEALAARALELAREANDGRELLGAALATAGNVSVWTGDFGRARAMYEEMLAVSTTGGFARGCAIATLNLGSLALLEREPERAVRICTEAVALTSQLDDEETRAVALFNLGCAHLEAGDTAEAASAFADSARIGLEGGFREHLAYCLVGVAAVAERRGHAREAGVLLGAADALLEEMGAALAPYERALHADTTAAVRGALGVDADRVWAEGRQHAPERALVAALTDVDDNVV